jgi:hypothetical protein
MIMRTTTLEVTIRAMTRTTIATIIREAETEAAAAVINQSRTLSVGQMGQAWGHVGRIMEVESVQLREA